MSRKSIEQPELDSSVEHDDSESDSEDTRMETQEEKKDQPDCQVMDSPVGLLSGSLSGMSTTRKTPRRNLSSHCFDTPPTGKQLHSKSSSDFSSGVFVDSPTPIDSPTVHRQPPRKKMSLRRLFHDSNEKSKSLDDDDGDQSEGYAVASTSSASADMYTDGGESSFQTTISREDSISQDSGISIDKDPNFKVPAPKFNKWKSQQSEDACSPFKYSPAKTSKRNWPFSPMDSSPKNTDGRTPVKLKRSAQEKDDEDDHFVQFLDQEEADPSDSSEAGGPGITGISDLLTRPVLNEPTFESSDHVWHVAPNTAATSGSDSSTPVREYLQAKRNVNRCQSLMEPKTNTTQPQAKLAQVPESLRSHSASETSIKMAVHKLNEEPDLIADSTKEYLLPTIAGKHQDLKSISHETLRRLLNGEYAEQVEDFHIIDCRYPYEYEGGHIKNAANIYLRKLLEDTYMKIPVVARDPSKRFILIFHCEFSSERGPSQYRHLRQLDRNVNSAWYPRLHYPEIYLLEGGYCTFYANHKDLCEPQGYVDMLHEDHSHNYLKFREICRAEKSGSTSGAATTNRSKIRKGLWHPTGK